MLEQKATAKRQFFLFEFSFVLGVAAICLTPLFLLFIPSEFFGTAAYSVKQIRAVPLFEFTYTYLVQNNRHLDANRFAVGASIVSIVYFFQLVLSLASPFFESREQPPAINLTRQIISLFVLWSIPGVASLFFPERVHTQDSVWYHAMVATNYRYIAYACFSVPFCALLYGLSLYYCRSVK